MRTTRRLAVASAVLGGGLLIAGPAAAQTTVDCDEYPELAECQFTDGDGGAGTADDDEDDEAGFAGGGATTSAASLPFTGGEVTLIALVGVAALGGGIALTAAGRKRSTA